MSDNVIITAIICATFIAICYIACKYDSRKSENDKDDKDDKDE